MIQKWLYNGIIDACLLVFLLSKQASEISAGLNSTCLKCAEVNSCHGYSVTNTTIAIAWLLRHPAKMQPVIGTMNQNRLEEICKASDLYLTREEWYQIYISAGNKLP